MQDIDIDEYVAVLCKVQDDSSYKRRCFAFVPKKELSPESKKYYVAFSKAELEILVADSSLSYPLKQRINHLLEVVNDSSREE